jgi:hypothetical protein
MIIAELFIRTANNALAAFQTDTLHVEVCHWGKYKDANTPDLRQIWKTRQRTC